MSIRVLLVDDQALLRTGFRMILEAQPDIEVVGEAVDGADAVRQVAALRPDVVLMDVRMPVMDGVEATAAIAAGGGDRAGARSSPPSTSTSTPSPRCGPAPAASCSRTCRPPSWPARSGRSPPATPSSHRGSPAGCSTGSRCTRPGAGGERRPGAGAGGAHRPRARGLRRGGAGADQRRDRRAAGPVGGDGEDAHRPGAGQAGAARPGAGGGLRLRARLLRASDQAVRPARRPPGEGGAGRRPRSAPGAVRGSSKKRGKKGEGGALSHGTSSSVGIARARCQPCTRSQPMEASRSHVACVLDALGDDLQAEVRGRGRRSRGRSRRPRPGAQVADEAAVDLHLVHRQALQVGQRGVAGAEVVDRQAHAELAQLRAAPRSARAGSAMTELSVTSRVSR